MPPTEERGNVDQNREDQNQEQYRAPSDRDGSSLRSDFYREDATQRFARVTGDTRSNKLAQVFKLGLTALGAISAYKFLHTTSLGVEIGDTIARLGRPVRRGWNKILLHLMESEAANEPLAAEMMADLRETGMSKLGSINKVRLLKEAVKIAKLRKQVGQDIVETDLGRAIKDSLNETHQAPAGMTMLSIGDVLKDNSVRGLIGRQQQQILQEGLSLGLVSKETQLGAGLFMTPEGIKTTQPFLAKNIGRFFMNKVLGNLEIPLIHWNLASIVRRPLAILGKHEGITAIPRGTFLPGVGTVAHEGSYLINGALFAQDFKGQYQRIAENLNPIFRSQSKDLFRIAGAMYGRYTEPEFSRNRFWKYIEKTFGVGPAYKTERSVLSSQIFDPIRRMARGEAVLKKEIKRKVAGRTPLRAILDHYLESGGYVSKEYGTVENIYKSVESMSPFNRFIDKFRAARGSGKYLLYEGKFGPIKGIELPRPGNALPGSEAVLVHRAHKWNMLANWLTMRPADLFSWTTGISFKPGTGLHGWMKNLARIYGIGLGVQMGVEAAKYLDYQIEDTTGVSPMKAVASAYVGLRYAQKSLADSMGITAAAQYSEKLMPLSMTSTLSGLSRAILPWMVGGVLGGKVGLIAGGAVSLLTGGPAQIFYPEDILKSAQIYKEEIHGERNVPVRANRWWLFNAEEFSGGRIKYFKPHWYHELMSDYQYTNVKYGSKKNYWKYVSPLPTPSNLFGLEKDAGWLGRVHESDRPYPYIPGEKIASRQAILAGANLKDSAVAANPNDLQSRLSRMYESGTEFLGLYKFLAESITGIQAPFKHQVALASSEEMSDLHHQFWESDIGGLGGLTELLRRYILPRNALPQSYNPLPNLMPSWLPGERSIFSADDRYFLNFFRGDPYRIVPHGEERLPGPGYEALHRMHSGQPGVYDALDRYLILADVAPYSYAYRHYRTIVRAWSKAGIIDQSWARKVDLTEQEVSAKMKGGRFVERRFTGNDRTLQAINESVKASGFEKAVGSAWEYATHDVISEIPIVGTKLLRARTPYKAYLEEQVYGETFRNWATPYQSFIKPHFQKAIVSNPIEGAGTGALAMYLGANPISRAILGITGAAIGGIGSSVRAISTGQWSGGWIPNEKKEEWAQMEYMDRLKYLRAKRLEGIAAMENNTKDMLYWSKQAARTMTGLPRSAPIGQVQAAMPPNLKKYFRGLVGTVPSGRQEVLQSLPPYIRPAFSKLWGQSTSRESPEQRAVEYFSEHEIPADNWLGWHPNIPFEVSQIKLIDTANGSPSTRLHHFGLWENQLSNYHLIYREMEAPSMEVNPRLSDDTSRTDNLRSELRFINHSFFEVQSRLGYGGQANLNIQFDHRADFDRSVDNFVRSL